MTTNVPSSRYISLALTVLDNAYSDYCRIVLNKPYIPPKHTIEYRPSMGWYIDGDFMGRRVSRVIDEIDRLQRYYNAQIKKYQAN